jgi:hypothetical protein
MVDVAPTLEPRTGNAASRTSGVLPFVVLGLLYLVAAAVYATLAHQSPVHLVQPDEIQYGSLAQSIARGEGLKVQGADFGVVSALYVYLIAPAWMLTSGSDAFSLAQTVGAAALCLTAVPVWLLARDHVGPWLAFIPTVLMLTGSWMLTAAGLLTENLALPLSAAALAALVPAVARPGSRWSWVALGFALLAALARAQLAVLLLVILVAIAVDCALTGERWRERLAAHRVFAAVTAGLTLAGLIVVASSSGVLGMYHDVDATPQADAYTNALKDQLTALLAMSAVIPVVVVAGSSLSRGAWRQERFTPLLIVTWAATGVFLAQSAWALVFVDGQLVPWHIQRYVEYPLPLLLVAMTVAVMWRRVVVRDLAIAGAFATLVLIATPGVRNAGAERGLFGIQERVTSVLGSSTGVSLALVAVLLVGAAAVAISRLRDRPVAALGAVSALTLLVFLVQAQVLWPWQDERTSSWRAGYPSDLSWVDHAAGGDAARLLVVGNSPRSEVTQLFNERIRNLYIPVTPIAGKLQTGRFCKWQADAQGVVSWETSCGQNYRRLLLDDDFAKIGFHGERVLAHQPGIGRLVALPDGPARIKSVLRVPCGPKLPVYEPGGRSRINPPAAFCSPALAGAFWLDSPGELRLRFRGTEQPSTVSFDDGRRVEQVPAGAVRTVTMPIAARSANFTAQLGQTGGKYPELIQAQLVEGGRKTELLY